MTRSLTPVLLLVLLTGCHSRPTDPPAPRIHGLEVRVADAVTRPDVTARGELLAVSADSLWLLESGDRLRTFALSGLVVRPGEGGRLRPHLWATIGGLATGIGLTFACVGYEAEAGCLAALPVTLGIWHGLALLARLFMVADPVEPLDPAPEALARYARFPAGLPPGFRRALQAEQ